MPGKRYDRAYFDRWYRAPATRVTGAAGLARRAALAVALAEYCLERPVRRVLDVGCGEGNWRAPLLKLCPNASYLGLDPSEYAVARFGRRRNLHRMDFAQLAEQRFGEPFDLIVCANVLQYLKPGEIRRGLSGFGELLHGVAFLEVYARGDRVDGDSDGFHDRAAGWYRKVFGEAGLAQCGPQAWVNQELAQELTRMELP